MIEVNRDPGYFSICGNVVVVVVLRALWPESACLPGPDLCCKIELNSRLKVTG